jgi:pSer/pThr/pTyr-binding forkhead associated (FHA) protein
VIGRGSDADITIADAGTSRRHVEILWDGERAMVRDMNSTNGTQLDGRRITEAPSARLDHHDRPHRHHLPRGRAGHSAAAHHLGIRRHARLRDRRTS